MTDKLQAQSVRDQLRAKVFSSENTVFKRKALTYKGAELEIKQPSLEEVTGMFDQPDSTSRAIYLLIHLAYIPGTDERVFEDTDFDTLKAMPYGPEMTDIQDMISEFFRGNAKEAEKNSEATPTSSTPTQ